MSEFETFTQADGEVSIRRKAADDLAAARERHGKVTADGVSWCIGCVRRGLDREDSKWPCDAARFRDALDEADAEWERAAEAVEHAAAERLAAARALADDLAAWVTEHQWDDRNYDGDRECFDCGYADIHDPDCATGRLLAKWEASK